MQRRRVLAALSASLLVRPYAAFAQSPLDDILDALRQQNYAEIHVRRTLLGRIRVTARAGRYQREIILNPATGKVLRDHSRATGPETPPQTPPPSRDAPRPSARPAPQDTPDHAPNRTPDHTPGNAPERPSHMPGSGSSSSETSRPHLARPARSKPDGARRDRSSPNGRESAPGAPKS